MGILFNNDNNDNNDNNEDTLPDGFYVEDNTIHDAMGNQVSLSYHSIDFPEAKLGAIYYHLIEKNGFFIPRNNKKRAWEQGLRNAVTRRSVPKGYLEALYDHHGSCPKHVREDYNLRDSIRRFGGQELYGGESINSNDEYVKPDKVKNIIDETINKSENEQKELSVDSKKLIVLIKAYVSGILVEDSQDWLALSNAYENLFEIVNEHISKENPIQSLRYAESFMEVSIPTEEYQKIQECSNLNRGNNSNNNNKRLNKVQKRLEQELLWD